MNDKQLRKANINNLTRLWKQMGTRPYIEGIEKFQMSLSWPNRCWFESELHVDEITTITRIINQTAESFIIPVWGNHGRLTNQLENILISSGFTLLFEQTAMYLDLENHPFTGQSSLELKPVESQPDIHIWTDIATRSFEYEIDESVIQKIVASPDVQLYMAHIDNEPAATVMLFNTGDIIGIHQMCVLPEYRGQGVARKLMLAVLDLCFQIPARYVTLQASTSGESLYRNLDFKGQFTIRNYQPPVMTNG